MAGISCNACEDLRQNSADFVVNGITDDICSSLSNNTGLNPSSDNDSCTDLHNINDCLVGNMENEVDAYEVCDWKEFTKNFIQNVWTTLKAIICTLCGLWSNMQNLIDSVSKYDCMIETLAQGKSLVVSEDSTDGSYVVAGKGVTFLKDDDSSGLAQVTLRYIGGGLVRVQGTLRFSTTNFTDSAACYSFDTDQANPQKSASRKGNSVWNHTATVTGSDGNKYHPIKTLGTNGELIYEIRLKKSEYPFVRGFYSGIAAPTGGGAYQVNLISINEGDTAHGQNNSSPTHVVPDGYVYIQARMINIGYLNATLDHHYSPRGFMGISLNSDNFDCD